MGCVGGQGVPTDYLFAPVLIWTGLGCDKNKPKRKDMELINLKKCNHKEIMSKGVTNSWALNQSTFNKVVEKIRKKRKKVYILFTKAGDSYKQALLSI